MKLSATLALIAGFGFAGTSLGAAPGITYIPSDPNFPAAFPYSAGFAINASGVVVGESNGSVITYGGGVVHGGASPRFDASNNDPIGINASGQLAVTRYVNPNDIRAVRFTGTLGSGGTVEVLPTLEGDNARGIAINDQADVVGSSQLTPGQNNHRTMHRAGVPEAGIAPRPHSVCALVGE